MNKHQHPSNNAVLGTPRGWDQGAGHRRGHLQQRQPAAGVRRRRHEDHVCQCQQHRHDESAVGDAGSRHADEVHGGHQRRRCAAPLGEIQRRVRVRQRRPDQRSVGALQVAGPVVGDPDRLQRRRRIGGQGVAGRRVVAHHDWAYAVATLTASQSGSTRLRCRLAASMNSSDGSHGVAFGDFSPGGYCFSHALHSAKS